MTRVRFVWNPAGYRAVNHSHGVVAELLRRGESVKGAYESDAVWDQRVSGVPGDETIPVRVEAFSQPRSTVVRVIADHPAAAAVEAKHRVLGRAADAAR